MSRLSRVRSWRKWGSAVGCKVNHLRPRLFLVTFNISSRFLKSTWLRVGGMFLTLCFFSQETPLALKCVWRGSSRTQGLFGEGERGGLIPAYGAGVFNTRPRNVRGIYPALRWRHQDVAVQVSPLHCLLRTQPSLTLPITDRALVYVLAHLRAHHAAS